MAATETLPVDHITTEGTQARAALSDTIIHEYAEAMARGDAFPPIEVYFDETTYWLADSFHRVHAAKIAGHTTIVAVVREGGTREALLHAVSANEEHGYRRTEHDEHPQTRVSPLRNNPPSHASPHALNRKAGIQLANGGELTYIPGFFLEPVADEMFAELRDGIAWEQIQIRGHREPRMTKWFGEFAYRYSGVIRPAVPWDTVPQAVRSVRSAVEHEVFGTSAGQFKGVLLNYYRTGDDRIGWHADDEKDILRDSPIASVSFGAERRFILKHNHTGARREITLAHGSLLVMAGTTQRFWKRCVPVERRIEQGRINLTSRMCSRGAA